MFPSKSFLSTFFLHFSSQLDNRSFPSGLGQGYPVTSTLNSKLSFPLSCVSSAGRPAFALHNQGPGPKAGLLLPLCPLTHCLQTCSAAPPCSISSQSSNSQIRSFALMPGVGRSLVLARRGKCSLLSVRSAYLTGTRYTIVSTSAPVLRCSPWEG